MAKWHREAARTEEGRFKPKGVAREGFKVCSRCETEKPRAEFSKNRHTKDGVRTTCRVCDRETRADYKARHRQEELNRQAESRRKSSDKRREQARQWRQANGSKTVKDPLAVKAQNAVRTAVKNGTLIRPAQCSECPSTGPLHGHHDDYSKPLEVRWLCQSCHQLHHRRPHALSH